jgi:hypothetical protein
MQIMGKASWRKFLVLNLKFQGAEKTLITSSNPVLKQLMQLAFVSLSTSQINLI